MTKRNLTGRTALFAALLSAFLLGACKGRTMENMTPTGDTVEVTPDTISAPAAPAVAAAPADSAQSQP